MGKASSSYISILGSLLVLIYTTWGTAATLHVASSAGVMGDGSAAAPFGTVAAAVEAAAPGDTILVRAGRYVITSPITIETPGVKLMGVSGERPTLIADEQTPAVIIVTASRVLVQDLIIRGGFYGIKVDVGLGNRPTRGVTIRNCAIGSSGADCLKIFNADALSIDGCHIGPSGLRQRDNAEGIDIIGSVGVTIRSCVVEDIATNGIYLKGGTRNGVIERCLVRRTGHGGILLGQDTDPEYMRDGARYEAINCVARNNIVADTQTAGLATYSGQDVSFVNNTLIDVARTGQAGVWVVTNTREVPSEGVQIRNNIVIVGGERPALFLKDTGLPDASNNIYFMRQGEPRFIREISSDDSMYRSWTLAQWQEASGKDAASCAEDPRIDPHHFRPLEGSPAIGKGATARDVKEDYFGQVRNETWDVGAVSSRAATATP